MKLLFQIIHTAIFYTITVVTFIIGTTITLPFAMFAKKKYVPFQFAARIWSRMLIFFSVSRVKVSGLNNVPKKGALIFAVNHQGAADILLMLAYLPRYFRFIIKKELFKVPIFGFYLKLAGYIPIQREMALAAYKTLGSAAKVLEDGECILIFPEGTRSRTGEVGPFKRGSLMIALQTGATIVPIGISGSFNILKKGSYLMNIAPITVKIGEPISFKEHKEADPSQFSYEKEVNELRNRIIELSRPS